MAFNSNAGSISVITGSNTTINASGAGINAVNEAASILSADNSSIEVTAAGTINSGTTLTGVGNQPAGILAGYLGPGGVVPTAFPLTGVNGNVVVNNSANITALGGDGIRAYNYGIGDVTVNDLAGTITALDTGSSTPGYGIGIVATNQGSGSIYVSTSLGAVINSGSSGIAAVNRAPSTGSTFAFPTTSAANPSVISVLAYGTITSGTIPTSSIQPATGTNDPAAGITAGYNPASGDAVDSNVLGNVSVDDYATIMAAAGTDGIRAVNYGASGIVTNSATGYSAVMGNISVIVEAGAEISVGRYGIAALGFDGNNVSVSNSGSVVAGTAVNAMTTGTGTVSIDDQGYLGGNATAYNATFTNEGDWSINGASVFTGTSTLTNSGLIQSNGVSSITGLASTTNTGMIEVETGSLKIAGPVKGAGTALIFGATLEFAAASDAHVQFNTGSSISGTLLLDDVAHFTGSVTGFTFGDTIDLVGIAPANVSVSSSGGLHVSYGTGSFSLLGNYDPLGFSVVTDNNGGTDIVWNHQAPFILTNNFTLTDNPDGTTTISGLQISDPDTGVTTISITATTAGAASGTSVSPVTASGSLASVNTTLAAGIVYHSRS